MSTSKKTTKKAKTMTKKNQRPKKEPVYSRAFLCALAAVARMGATIH